MLRACAVRLETRAHVHVIIMNSDRVRVDGLTMERFSVESCVRGYHVYKDISNSGDHNFARTHVKPRMRVRAYEIRGWKFS